ncbi:DUF3558 family protein [Antrihabitans stalactiti]|uniref:DUF3558 family protein n=1 Tax=Antrihabitans stalactiti TaxID=2584121 RepID=UPI00146D1B58
MRLRGPLLSALLLFVVAGCSLGADDGDAANSLASSLTAVHGSTTTVVPQGLEPPKQFNENGRADVTFDPCFDFDDEVIKRAGLDPASRQRTDIAAEYTFLGCVFLGKDFSAGVTIGNVTFEENIERYKNDSPQFLTINGRESLLVRSDIAASSCAIVVRMARGVMLISIGPDYEPTTAGNDGCVLAPDVARAFEPALPKDR